MLSSTNTVGRWDYYSGQSDVYRHILKILKGCDNKTCEELYALVEAYINEPFVEWDENSHYYKDGQKDTLLFFGRLFIPLGHTVTRDDSDRLIIEITKKLQIASRELNDILEYLRRR